MYADLFLIMGENDIPVQGIVDLRLPSNPNLNSPLGSAWGPP